MVDFLFREELRDNGGGEQLLCERSENFFLGGLVSFRVRETPPPPKSKRAFRKTLALVV